MTKRKKLQLSLWLTAVLATVFFFYAPILHIPLYGAVLFWLLVFLPQAAALMLRLGEVRERYEAFKKEVEGLRLAIKARNRPMRRRGAVFAASCFAMIKSDGINPNRAGPFRIFV